MARICHLTFVTFLNVVLAGQDWTCAVEQEVVVVPPTD